MNENAYSKNSGGMERKIYMKLIDWEIVHTSSALLSLRQNELCILVADYGSQEHLNCDVPPNQLNCVQNADNAIAFLVWFDLFMKYDNIDNLIDSYCEQLKQCCCFCDAIYHVIILSTNTLRRLNAKWEYTFCKTISLNEASQNILNEQHNLMQVHDGIRNNICYFTQIDQLAHHLQSVMQITIFRKVGGFFTSIDESMLFIKKNEKFKDATPYITRCKHLLSKVIDLIRNYVSQLIKNTATESLVYGQEYIADQDVTFAVYYGKFHNSAGKIKLISKLIEDRLNGNIEYEILLSDMHKVYFTERAVILIPAIRKSIASLTSTNKGDYCILFRSICGLLAHICQDEHSLFFLFFSLGCSQLMSYLEGLCLLLYDALRPHLIHINHLETLAEICGIMKIEMIDGNSQVDGALKAFIAILRQLIHDAQERLVFRTHIYIQSDILHYNPSSGDLAYPHKLQMMESIAATFNDSKTNSFAEGCYHMNSAIRSLSQGIEMRPSIHSSSSPADLHGMWYPTVRRTLICLSRLYRCVDPIVFQGLSQEAIRCCIKSIDKAALRISQNQKMIDGFLFQIKHLLILREQMAPFRTDFTIKETSLDFSKMKTAAFDLLQKRKDLFLFRSNNALLEFLFEGTPQVKEYFMDSRKELDNTLKIICEQFIKCSANQFVGPLLCFIDNVQTFLSEIIQTSNMNSSNTTTKKRKLQENAWASASYVKDLIRSTSRKIKHELPVLQRTMKLYLSNRDTEFIIFRLVKNNIISTFAKLEHLILNNGYTANELVVIDCPSAEQVAVLISCVSILSESADT